MTSRILPELITAYFKTVISIQINDFHSLVIKGSSRKTIPLPLQGSFNEDFLELWVITAENPYSQRLIDEENSQRQQTLFNELTEKGIEAFEAQCSSPDGTWSEQSFAVPVNKESALKIQGIIHELARSFGQNAVFKITQSNLSVISTLDENRDEQSVVLFKSNYCCELN